GGADLLLVAGLEGAPAGEVAGAGALGQDPVDHDRVRVEAEQVQVGEGPPRLGQDHLLGVDDQPDGGDGRVAEQGLHLLDLAEELLDLVEGILAGRLQPAGDQPGGRPGQADDASLDGKDAIEPPADDVGVAQEPQRLAGGGAINDQDVEAALAGVPEDLQQAE